MITSRWLITDADGSLQYSKTTVAAAIGFVRSWTTIPIQLTISQFTFDQIQEATYFLESNEQIGKIVVTV